MSRRWALSILFTAQGLGVFAALVLPSNATWVMLFGAFATGVTMTALTLIAVDFLGEAPQ